MKLNKFGKFKTLAVATVLVAAGMTSAHAAGYGSAAGDDYEQPQAQTQQISQEDVGNFFKGVWNKTKEVTTTVVEKTSEVAATAGEKTKEVGSTVGVAVGKGMQSAGKGIQNMAEQAEKASKEKKQEPKVQKAEVQGPITSEDVVKAKDKVVEGVSSFLNKLRSEPTQENNNTPKPY